MLQRIVNKYRTNYHLMLFSSLWVYTASVKTTTDFTPFHLVFGEEVVLAIECKIPSLHIAIELVPYTQPLERRLFMLERAYEDYHVAFPTIEVGEKHAKAQYD